MTFLQRKNNSSLFNNQSSLSELQLDALKEIGSIASSYVASELSRMTKNELIIEVPETKIFPVEELSTAIKHIDNKDEIAAVYTTISGKYEGFVFFVFSVADLDNLSRYFLLRKNDNLNVIQSEYSNNFTDHNEFLISSLAEIGNICSCVYLNAISRFLHTVILPSPPAAAIDMQEAILQQLGCIVGETSSFALIIQTLLVDNNNNNKGIILFLPDQNTQELIFSSFGI